MAESILTAAQSGSTKRLLEAMRDLVAETLDSGVHPRDMAALTKRLRELVDDIHELDAGTEGDVVSSAAATADEPLRIAS